MILQFVTSLNVLLRVVPLFPASAWTWRRACSWYLTSTDKLMLQLENTFTCCLTVVGLCTGTKVRKHLKHTLPIIRDIPLCSPYVNRRFGAAYHLHLHGRKSAEQEISV
jgi:hypothetical protein